MKQRLFRIYVAVMAVLLSLPALVPEVCAAVPPTGDERGGTMSILFIVLGISLVLIIAMLVLGKKKK